MEQNKNHCNDSINLKENMQNQEEKNYAKSGSKTNQSEKDLFIKKIYICIVDIHIYVINNIDNINIIDRVFIN